MALHESLGTLPKGEDIVSAAAIPDKPGVTVLQATMIRTRPDTE
jgi:hypothetical protein